MKRSQIKSKLTIAICLAGSLLCNAAKAETASYKPTFDTTLRQYTGGNAGAIADFQDPDNGVLQANFPMHHLDEWLGLSYFNQTKPEGDYSELQGYVTSKAFLQFSLPDGAHNDASLQFSFLETDSTHPATWNQFQFSVYGVTGSAGGSIPAYTYNQSTPEADRTPENQLPYWPDAPANEDTYNSVTPGLSTLLGQFSFVGNEINSDGSDFAINYGDVSVSGSTVTVTGDLLTDFINQVPNDTISFYITYDSDSQSDIFGYNIFRIASGDNAVDSLQPQLTVAPEPASMTLLLVGGLGLLRRRRRANSSNA